MYFDYLSHAICAQKEVVLNDLGGCLIAFTESEHGDSIINAAERVFLHVLPSINRKQLRTCSLQELLTIAKFILRYTFMFVFVM